MILSTATPAIPDHVPPYLVVNWPYGHGDTTVDEPHGTIDPLSSGPGVFFVPGWPFPSGTWVVRTPELWREVVMMADHITTFGFAPFAKLSGGSWKMIPIEIDPPLHNKYRSVLNPLLGPKAISALDDKILAYARHDVGAFRDRGECEFMEEFAFEYPIRIFLELMGLPLEQTAQFLKWERGMLSADTLEERRENVLAIVDYLNGEIAARREAPGGGFMGHIVQAEIEGRKLDDDEVLGTFFTLFTGGLDTVSVHLSFMVRHLAENPGQQDYLRANPDQIPNAMEELMRFYGTAGSLRTCTKDMEIAGAPIKTGDRIMAHPLFAGRDAGEYGDPEVVRFDRGAKHLAFGYGPHVCIGIHLAKRELRTALATMLEMLPPFRIAPGAEIVSEMSGMMRPRTLPLVWDI